MTMTGLHTDPRAAPRGLGARRSRWPLSAAAAGLSGLLVPLDPLPAGGGALLVCGAVATLLLLAAQWRRCVEPRVRSSTAANLVPMGLVTSAATLLQTSGWAGWLGVAVAATGVAWMALRERTVSPWIGVASLLPGAVMALDVAGADLSGAAGLVGPAWLVVAGLGLALGRSTITR
jgi:hypothetical protein